MKNLIVWFFGSFFLGLLPVIVNSMVQYILGNMSFFSVFKIGDLMCFVITLSATTLLGIILQARGNYTTFQTSAIICLITQLLIASLLLGLNSLLSMSSIVNYDKVFNKIVFISFTFSVVSAITTMVFQLILIEKIGQKQNSVKI